MTQPTSPPARSSDEAAGILAAEVERLRSRPGLTDVDRHAVAAWSLMHYYEFEAAAEGWSVVHKARPDDVEAAFRRAHCLLELGRFDDAATAFRETIDLDARLAEQPGTEGLDWLEDDPAYRLGNCLHASGDLPAAVEAYELSTRRNTIGRGGAAGAGAVPPRCTRGRRRARRPGPHGEPRAAGGRARRGAGVARRGPSRPPPRAGMSVSTPPVPENGRLAEGSVPSSVDAPACAIDAAPGALGRDDRPPPRGTGGVFRRLLRISAGVALFVFGVVELLLPGPGILFMAIGLTLLAPDIPFVRRLVVGAYRRWPALRRRVPRRYRRTK